MMSHPQAPSELHALFGAEWRPLNLVDPGHELAHAAAAARAAGGSHFTVVEGDGEVMVGWARGVFEPGTRLAGQLLASVVTARAICPLLAIDQPVANPFRAETLLFVGVHPSGEHVAVAVLNGVPVFDLIGPADRVQQRAQEFAGKLHEGGLLLVQQGCEAAFEAVKRAAPAAFRSVAALPFDAQWETHTAALRTVGVSRARLGLLAAATAAVLVPASVLAYRRYANQQLTRLAEEKQKEQSRNALAAFEQLQLDALRQHPLVRADAGAHMAFEFARKLLDDRAGFRMNKLFLSPQQSTAQYSRFNKARTFTDFVSVSDEGTPTFTVTKLDLAAVSFPPLAWDRLPTVNTAVGVNAAAVMLDLGSLAQRTELLGVKLAATAPAVLLNPEQLARVDAARLPHIGRKAGTWSATGPADLFVPLCDAMPKEGCTLSEVEFIWGTDAQGLPADTFRAAGRYIVGWS